MGLRTIKIGDKVIVRKSHHTKVTDIINGRYQLEDIFPGDAVNSYSATEIRKPATENKPIKRTAIKRSSVRIPFMSQKRDILLQIYSVLRKIFLTSNPICQARLCNCTRDATEIHHKAGRDNLLLIIVRWFLPVCRPCHDELTVHSDAAIEAGLSFPRNSVTEVQLSEAELKLLEEYGYRDRYKISKQGVYVFSVTEIYKPATENENLVTVFNNAAE